MSAVLIGTGLTNLRYLLLVSHLGAADVSSTYRWFHLRCLVLFWTKEFDP